MPRKTRKHLTPPEQLANDPSLKWNAYKKWEALWSDSHGETLRFARYEGDRIVLATLNIADLPGTVDPLSVRRPTVMDSWATVSLRCPEGHRWFAINRGTGERVACGDQDEADAECRRRNHAYVPA